MKNDVKNSAYRIKNNPISSAISLSSVECWGFGDQSIEKIVISNHNSEKTNFSLTGYKLKKEWSYGGYDAFDDFLLREGSYTASPQEISQPNVFSGESLCNTIEIEPYSMMVCEVSKDENILTAAFNIADDSEDVAIDNVITVTFSRNISVDLNEYLTITANDSAIGYTISKVADNKYEIIPQNGLKTDTDYKIILESFGGMGEDETLAFKTRPWRLYDNFTQTTHIATVLSAGDGYEITFQVLGETNFSIRGIPIYLMNKTVYYRNGNTVGNNSLYPNKALRVLGHYNFNETGGNFKVIVCGTEIALYGKSYSADRYEYIGTIYNVDHSSEEPSFDGKIQNINAKINPYPLTSLEFSVTEKGKQFYSNTMLPGENVVNIKADDDVCVIFAEYDEGRLVNSRMLKNEGEYSFVSENNDLQKVIYVWDSMDTIVPLQGSIFIN